MNIMKALVATAYILLWCSFTASAQTAYRLDKMRMDRLDRGVVAMRVSADSVLISWRYLPGDPMDTRFEVYRDGVKIGETDSRQSTTWTDALPKQHQAVYSVRPVSMDKRTNKLVGNWTVAPHAPVGYIDLPLQRPNDELDVNGSRVTYIANDASAADLDGDGQLEIILKWDPSNSKDNSHSGVTNNTYIDAYKLNGQRLWRIDLGRNIRSGAHYTQFLAYDFDGDGCAEVAMRTSDGTKDARGKVIGDASADWRVGMEVKG
ncbi:MAG: hypothetical protein HUK02_05750, partial [Bacteroidaceae bacterium]|nr:hypothetical protein [Bacteroidaceae bacterium]